MKPAIWISICLPALLVGGELKPDIEFARRDGVALTMDAFVPEGPGPAPAGSCVHGAVRRVHPNGPCMVDGHIVENPGPMCLSPGLSKFLGVTAESPKAEDVVRKASPATYVKKNMPAYLLIHGTKDYNVPFEQSE